jgi:multiple sugar transport system substrate-binding protein
MSPISKPAFFRMHWLLIGILILISACTMPRQEAHVVWLEDLYGRFGLGSDANTSAWVNEFNAAHDDVELELYLEHGVLDLVDNWRDLRLQGHEFDHPFPDVAPLSTVRRYGQWDVWLDLTPHLQEYDLSVFHPAALRAWQDKDGNQFGLPVTMYGPLLVYNRDLFDAAGIPYPPHRYGEPYADGEEWTIEKMEEIAILLTLDIDGRNPTHPDFNANEIVQFGFMAQWMPLADIAALFGTDAVFDGSGPVSLQGSWSEAVHWLHSGIWEKHFIPNKEQTFNIVRNTFSSGQVAMAYAQTGIICCIEPTVNWDLAALPSHNGRVTASLTSEGFGIVDISPQPEAAVEALYYLATLPELSDHVGGISALTARQTPELSEWDGQLPEDVDLQVARDSLIFPEFAPQPYCALRHSGFAGRLEVFLEGMTSAPLPDVDAALDELTAELQEIVQKEGSSCP